MFPLNNIDLLSLQGSLKFGRSKSGQVEVLDRTRKKFVRATPEEIVRQLWLVYLVDLLGVNIKLISIERMFEINGLGKRFDLVVFSKSTHPILLAEFKAPAIRIQQSVFDQIAQYNMKLKVPYALISNGSDHYCFQIDDEAKGFVWKNELPILLASGQ
ncbi:MAG: type I restriction enzyme HsdR N-terminal domain-containing protein [Saprospiraceae bacterium]